MEITVNFAVYGALAGGNENDTQAISVAAPLQALINANQGIVNIGNEAFGDPSYGNLKHFGAQVTYSNGSVQCFACQEGQTIDFYHWEPVTVA